MLSAAETHALRSRRWARPAWPNIVDFPDHATFRENVAKLACADISPSESSISYLGRVAKRCHVALTRVMRGRVMGKQSREQGWFRSRDRSTGTCARTSQIVSKKVLSLFLINC